MGRKSVIPTFYRKRNRKKESKRKKKQSFNVLCNLLGPPIWENCGRVLVSGLD